MVLVEKSSVAKRPFISLYIVEHLGERRLRLLQEPLVPVSPRVFLSGPLRPLRPLRRLLRVISVPLQPALPCLMYFPQLLLLLPQTVAQQFALAFEELLRSARFT